MREQLLEMLSAGGTDYMSGEELSRRLGVSRTAVWKQIRKLEAEGYTIEASRSRGYRLAAEPDQLTVTGLLARLNEIGAEDDARSLARQIKLFDELDSTQDTAKRLAEDGAPEGTIVIAERQTRGRGRLGRSWISPRGKGVWMSLILRPGIPMVYTPQLTLLAAVALCRAVRRQTGLEIGIKWPNDLLYSGRKISGILLESSAEEDRLKYVVAGIGISVNLEASDYPPELTDKAVSLRLAAGRAFDRTETIALFLQAFGELYGLYRSEGFGPIRLLWEALSVSLGKPCILTTPQGRIEGVPMRLNDAGALVVRLADGAETAIYSAEMG